MAEEDKWVSTQCWRDTNTLHTLWVWAAKVNNSCVYVCVCICTCVHIWETNLWC